MVALNTGPEYLQNDTMDFISSTRPIHVGIASIPIRRESLRETVGSLYDSVDYIHVYLNNYPAVPEFLHKKKIHIIPSYNALGDLGDAGKFFMAGKVDGYYFTCDDDLIYPRGYVDVLVNKLRRYPGCVVGLHGKVFPRRNITSYYNDTGSMAVSHYKRNKTYDSPVHLLGTGTVAFDTSYIDVSLEHFPESMPNMADIHFAKHCEEERVLQISIARPEGWVTERSSEETIYDSARDGNDVAQTKVVNNVEWQAARWKACRLIMKEVKSVVRRGGCIYRIMRLAVRHAIQGRP